MAKDSLDLKVDLSAYDAGLLKIIRATKQRHDLMTALAGTMLDAVEENFQQEGRPKWAGWSPAYAKKRAGGKILQKTGRLAASIRAAITNDEATVGTNVRYARIHNEGGEIKHEARTQDLHFKKTEPSMKQWKAGHTGSRFAKKRNANFVMSATIGAHTVKMPARPFLQLTADDVQELENAAIRYFINVID